MNVEYLNKIKNSIDSGPIDKLDFVSHKYNWNYGPFQKEVEELCKYFNVDEDYCTDFVHKYGEINRGAERSFKTIVENIQASDDHENKPRFIIDSNRRWNEYKNVVDTMFKKVYKAQCEKPEEQLPSENEIFNNTQTNKVNENTQITANDYILNIESLSIEPAYGLLHGQPAKVRFTTKWDGKFMERVQLKLLIDKEVVLDEIHAFRNNMGDFLSEFSKTLPSCCS